MPTPTIEWVDGRVRLIDQTLLPNEFKQIYCDDVGAVWEAIKMLRVRGAPAIGVAAALGTVLGIWIQQPNLFRNSKSNLARWSIIWLHLDRPRLTCFGLWTG